MALAVTAASAAGAEEVLMNGEDFGAYVDGQTVTYARDGRVYGMEQYLPGQKVIWRQIDGACEEGVWYVRDGLICFDYGDGIPLQCWQFFRDGARLGARADGDPQGLWLYEVRRSAEPMQCPAPYLGV